MRRVARVFDSCTRLMGRRIQKTLAYVLVFYSALTNMPEDLFSVSVVFWHMLWCAAAHQLLAFALESCGCLTPRHMPELLILSAYATAVDVSHRTCPSRSCPAPNRHQQCTPPHTIPSPTTANPHPSHLRPRTRSHRHQPGEGFP
jgi:hypothetical protein